MVRNEVELVHLLAHFPLDGGHVALCADEWDDSAPCDFLAD